MYLPTLHKNELLYSWVGRFVIHSLISISRGRLKLFGSVEYTMSLRFPRMSPLINQQIFNSNEAGNFVSENTLIKLYLPFLSQVIRDEILNGVVFPRKKLACETSAFN